MGTGERAKNGGHRSLNVQLASHAGATVIATASGDDQAYVKSLGASRVIDYREAQFEKVLQEKVDVVFNLIRGDTQTRSFLVLKEGGYLVSATEPVSQCGRPILRVDRDNPDDNLRLAV